MEIERSEAELHNLLALPKELVLSEATVVI
jgi:hypothetical protein